jgi:hypothetical protein
VTNENQVFKKITHDLERSQLLSDLAAAQAELLCKGAAEAVFRLQPTVYDQRRLHCTVLKTSSAHKIAEESMIVHFSLGGEKYFFRGVAFMNPQNLSSELQTIFFTNELEIFHLQRRQNYRIKIPESYTARFEVTAVNKSPVKWTGRLDDLSSGGCRVAAQNPIPFKINDDLDARLLVGRRDPIDLVVKVRHLKADEEKKTEVMVGMEFERLNTSIENRMFAITLELHRELFSRLK